MTADSATAVPAAAPRRSWSSTRVLSYGSSAFASCFVLAMLLLFLVQSLPIWEQRGAAYVLEGTWFYREEIFGALAMVYGTGCVALIALFIAAPIGIGAAVFIAEIVPQRLRLPLKVVIEMLAAVPSVVYGLLGVLFLRTIVYDTLVWLGLEPLSGDSLLTAGLLLAAMILPTIVTLSDDALRSVPRAQRLAARGLGLSRAQAIRSVCLPQARKGILAAVLLALGRALGETIAVFLVVGRQDNQLPQHWFSIAQWIEPGQTLTSKLGGAETNIAYGSPLHWAAVVGLGLLLLSIVVLITFVGSLLAKVQRA